MRDEPGLLASLLPAGAVAADILDQGQALALRPDEAVFVATAGSKRQRDFTLGRQCAHLALARLGVRAAAIAPDARGAPQWPDGVVGSITHTGGYAAAIAAPDSLFGGLGIDAEPVGGVTEALFARLFTARECETLSSMEADARAHMAAILFCAKEAHYKAARQASPLRFRDLDVTLRESAVSVQAGDGARSTGRFAVTRDLAIVVLSVPV